jgi:glutamate carboxypeptidase
LARPLAIASAALVLGSLPAAHAAGLSAPERRMVAAIAAHHEQDVQLLEQLVNTNSGTYNLAGVIAVAGQLRAQFELLGMSVRWVPMGEVGRAGHLIAEHHARGGHAKRILMIAHLDTVFEADSPFQRFVRRGDIAEGPGTNDIKGGVVVILAALRALKETGVLARTNVTVYLSGDEEDPGLPLSIARRDLIAAGKASDLALDYEAMSRENDRDTIHIGRRGFTGWSLTVSATSGHSSGVGRDGGYGANYELARIIDEFRRTLPEPNLTFNTSLIAGGTTAAMSAAATSASASGKDNVIAAQAVAAGELRTLSDEQLLRVQQEMRAIVAQHLAGSSAEIRFTAGYPAMAPTGASEALFAQLSRINDDLGLAPLALGDPARRGAGDISFVAADVPGLVGMGVVGDGAHDVSENVDLRSLQTQAVRTAILIARLSPP